MNLQYDKEITEWINQNREALLSEWIELSKIPAIKGKPCKNAPFGAECALALKKCSELFERHGFSSKLYDESGYALVTYGSGEKTIGIFSHSDVVPVGDDWLFTQPFEPIIKDGALIGRGVEDNKSGIMAALCAMEIIRKYSIPVKSRLQLFIGSNEETGMEDIKAFVKEQPMPEISLVPDADFPCSTGEKGICQFTAKSTARLSDILDFCGGEAFNIVLDKATVVLKNSEALKAEITEKLGGNDKIMLSEENGRLTLCAKGIAKHASDPDGSVNAAYLLAELLSGTTALSENDREIMSRAKHILSCPFGTSMGLDHCDELFGRLTFVNGVVSVSDGQLALSFDMRYSSSLDPNELEEKTKAAFEKLGWFICDIDNKKGFSIDPGSKIPQILEEIYNSVTGFDKKSIKLGGGTYARIIENAFSVGTYTATADRTTPVLTMPPGHGCAHQCDEMIDIESFFAAVRVITHYIIAMDEEINK